MPQYGAYTQETAEALARDITSAGGVLIRDRYYLNPAVGNDNNSGEDPRAGFQTLAKAYDKLEDGRNDAVILVGNGQASGSARLDAAFTWAKSAAHLIGAAAPTRTFGRARIATQSGATAFANFITNTGDGNVFSNISLWHGFGTGTAAQICWTDTGERNYYENVFFGGMGDQASADDAGSRCLKIGSGGNGEHTFVDCAFGTNTVTRGAANACIEFAGATPRNFFRRPVFLIQADAASPLALIGSGAGCMDREQVMESPIFLNGVFSGSTTLTAVGTFPASPGGGIILKNPTRIGFTDWGSDANSLAAIYVDGAATGATDDIGRGAVAIAT
jgi:hypothetical protein